MQQLWVVTGPNGAGKSTIADRWLAPRISVISPDNIAITQTVSPVRAGKLAIKEQEQLLTAGGSGWI